MNAPKISRIGRGLSTFLSDVNAAGFGYVCEWPDSGDYRVQLKRDRKVVFSVTDKSPDYCVDQAYVYLARARDLKREGV